ncbi:MAG: amidohydrolase [Bacteroidales bacterium]|nr:MAG: amidohydrolase [Bacteroidales bacterium]
MIIPDIIKALARKYREETISYRRNLHMYPELSFKEYETSRFIAEQLERSDILFQTGYVKTGIVGKIRAGNPGAGVVALRADMDALPIREENQVSYRSKNNGIMHACGHDLHMASLLGAAKILKELDGSFDGTVLLVFQPGEELIPGGASLMIEEGALNNPKPDLIIAQHVSPDLEAGKMGFRNGKYMASSDEIYMTIRGKGGHAALPDQTTDTVLITSRIIVELKEMITNKPYGGIPTILSFGRISAEGATNVIPGEVTVEGTFRTFDEEWRKEAHLLLSDKAKEIAAESGGICEFHIAPGYPFLINDEKVTRSARKYTSQYIGEENIVPLDLRMTSEDFAYFSQVFPATLFRLGTRNEKKNIISSLHSPTFDIDEDIIELSSGNLAWLTVSFLSEKQTR